ncbi:NACHT domain-containing protein [Altericroceibacterium endophyticum]|uniref:NACHT domain-containing protein n=1 Tax=Altericroceibacterium endophyticum TaxID=1808508 RepID=UPI0019268154|nr:ATP-binding protein [Altericroceibacterium endophyticum]
MATESETNDIERSFQDIPDDKITEAEQTAFLLDLGWHKGSNWADLLKSKRILIISEAGAGKTYECRTQQQVLWAAGEPAFYVELADLARNNLRELLSHDEEIRFVAWHASQSDVATFFLDSIDELKLSLGSFEQALKRLAKAVAGQLGRVRVIITSRPIPVDEQIFRQILPVPDEPDEAATSEEFANSAMARRAQKSSEEQIARDWRNVALLPLSTAQIKQMAIKEGVEDPDALLTDIRQRNAEEFVRRPQDLIELCADWREHRRIRSHRDQVASNIAVKLKPRQDGREKAALSADKALEGARRLALAASLSRKLTLRHSAEADREGDPADAPLDPSSILHDWTQDERTTLLERSLFGFASYGRVRFHHRSVIEYLAAEHLLALREQGVPVRSIKRILFTTTTQGDEVVKPSLRPVAAWMAFRDDAIFEEVLRREPDVLLNFGDPESLSPAQRQRALRAYVERHSAGGWRGLRVPSVQLHRFAAADLGPEVQHLWEGGIENHEIREILLNLIGLGKMADCADIVYGIAVDATAPEGERIDALDALIHLNDARLATISNSLAQNGPIWPNRLSRAALLRLFPAHLSVKLLCKVLTRITEKKRSVGDISWNLPRLIEHVDLSPDALDALRHGLTELAVEGIAWNEKQWPRLASKRQFLLPALATTCLRQIQNGTTTPEVMRSTAIALRLAEREYDHTEPAKQLEAALPSLPPDARRLMFEAEDTFLQAYQPQTDPFKRYARLAFHRAALHLGAVDAGWVLASLADRGRSADDRAMMLEAAIRIREDNVEWTDHLASLKPRVDDLPDLVERLDQLAQPRKPDPEELRWQREDAKRQKQEERRDAKAHASWVMFWCEIVNDPEAVFAADRSQNTAWNLWRAMERNGEESRASGWNRRFIERHFGKEVADRLRLAVMAFWRKDRPTLRSERPEEEKGTYLTRWQLGLAGIYAEAEDPQWAEKLSQDEAELALRYVSIELNGFPAWLEGFATVHPAAVDTVLGAELTAELDEQAVGHSGMLQDIQYGAPTVARLFVPRLRTWLDAGKWRLEHNEDETARANRLRQVVQILVQHGDSDITAHIHTLAKTELAEGAKDAVNSIWLPVLMRLDAADGIDALEKTVKPHAPAKLGPATDWFSSLFGDRHGDGETYLSASGFTPDLLLRLARLAYQYIRPSDDIVREEGSFSPNARDHAERGRSNIVNALLSTTGAEGWAIKLRLADDPLFADFKDRALAMARERAAEEADAAAFTESDIVALDRYGELPPLTRDELFALLTDRLDDMDDALLRDDSPRAAWALINDEKIMRQQIARELRTNANGAYTVDQEAVTADEKETDIRLRSTGSIHEAIIELKIGEKDRSAADLKATIKDQLVVKYMAAENSRAGCLLITVNSARTWLHPETGAALDLAGLIAMLNEEAARIEQEMGGSLQLIVRGLDLQPRLPTERAKLRGRQRKASSEREPEEMPAG